MKEDGRPGAKVRARVLRVEGGRIRLQSDLVATEEPLEIRLSTGGVRRSLAVTMRTPGADFELAAGFLYSEGVLRCREDIAGMTYCVDRELSEEQRYNVVNVALSGDRMPDLAGLDRHFTTTSACGVCGRASLDSLRLRGISPLPPGPLIGPDMLQTIPEKLRGGQGTFRATGGLHAAALFDCDGELIALREDVGRHNATDKLIGWALLQGRLPLHDHLVTVSGRSSFEIVQKCLVAGVPIICSVSAPSSLAVSMSRAFDMTLIGFLRGTRFNIYSCPERVGVTAAGPVRAQPGLDEAPRAASTDAAHGSERLLTPAAMRAEMLESVPVLAPRSAPLVEAGGLILAEALVAPFDLPRFPNSAMDGYAVRSQDLAAAPARLRLAGRSLAGEPATVSLRAGEAISIATGALLPKGADAVVAVEETTRVGGEVIIEAAAPAGMHVRLPGEDIVAGDLVVEVGVVLGAGQLAAAAALGYSSLSVHPPPRVAVLPTGNEVRGPGVVLGPGEIYDALSVPLAVLLKELGALPLLQSSVPDDPQSLMEALRTAAAQADAILTIGGVSVGERDLVRGLRSVGEVRGFQLALRPAKPFAFGTVFDRPLFGLPGNPASALVAFEELVRPALLHMMGRAPRLRLSATAILAEPIRQTPGRMHLVRAKVWSKAGRLYAAPAGRQGAGMLHSLAAANAYAVVGAEVDELAEGSEIEVRLLAEL